MKMNNVSIVQAVASPAAEKGLSYGELADLCVDLRAQNARLLARITTLEEEICRDTLTPLFNRRHFEKAVAVCIAHCERYDSRAALLFVDVDDLKLINDSYGHAAGDEALRAIADVLLANVRTTDVVARIGGDEFAVLLGAISEADILTKISDLRTAIAACRPGFGGDEPCLSASFGHAFIHPGDQAAKVLEHADRAMYRAKPGRRTARA
ncbi:GGDEF domain-containing protein [Blastomonas sp.]|uniref:GGDEF domain-containing protein n=1 Tax=Blastomonas sp. TaxID=1909299 RepID=UPI0035938106